VLCDLTARKEKQRTHSEKTFYDMKGEKIRAEESLCFTDCCCCVGKKSAGVGARRKWKEGEKADEIYLARNGEDRWHGTLTGK